MYSVNTHRLTVHKFSVTGADRPIDSRTDAAATYKHSNCAAISFTDKGTRHNHIMIRIQSRLYLHQTDGDPVATQ